MSKNLVCLILFAVVFMATHVWADSLSKLSDVTVVDGTIISFRYEGTEYVVEEGVVSLGTTTRWYIVDGVEILWEEGDPVPPEAPTVPDPSSNAKIGDVGSKGEAIWELLHLLQSRGFILNAGEVLEIILQRERQGGTTLGEGIAILHGRIPAIPEPCVAMGVLPRDHGIDFGGEEEAPIDIIYMVLSPQDKPEAHLEVLATIAEFLSNSDVRAQLRGAKNELEAMRIIKKYE